LSNRLKEFASSVEKDIGKFSCVKETLKQVNAFEKNKSRLKVLKFYDHNIYEYLIIGIQENKTFVIMDIGNI
jgi:hypothetical protein